MNSKNKEENCPEKWVGSRDQAVAVGLNQKERAMAGDFPLGKGCRNRKG